MNHSELQQTFFDNYKLRVSYCRTLYEKGGVCIFGQESLRCVRIDLEKYCKDKDWSLCHQDSIQLQKCMHNCYIQRPTGNFDLFITKLDTILRKLYIVTNEYIICGDTNIDYLVDSDNWQLEALLKTYNLTSVVNFPTRTQKNSSTGIDNIFIDFSKMGNYSICPVINDLSDHNITFFQSETTHQKKVC